MGKGDKKSRRGKIWKGTYGVRRPHKAIKTVENSQTSEKNKSEKSK